MGKAKTAILFEKLLLMRIKQKYMQWISSTPFSRVENLFLF